MLEITNLHAEAGGREILRGLDLELKAGEVHAIMGPNGGGKSTLAQVLAGRDSYVVTAEKMSLLHMDDTLMKRAVNEGFSGGEKKRNEIFQMAVLEPKLAILDETED